MAFQTRCAVSGSTTDGLLIVRDTVEVDTRARRATSWIVLLGWRRSEGRFAGLTARLYLGFRGRDNTRFCKIFEKG